MCILSGIYNGLVVWNIPIELDLKPTLSWVVFLFNYLGHGPWFLGLEWCWRSMECMHKHHVGFGRCNIMELTSLVILNDNACTSIRNVGLKALKRITIEHYYDDYMMYLMPCYVSVWIHVYMMLFLAYLGYVCSITLHLWSAYLAYIDTYSFLLSSCNGIGSIIWWLGEDGDFWVVI